ncbi:hypothetical protein D3C81_2014570 [compost metagenome]
MSTASLAPATKPRGPNIFPAPLVNLDQPLTLPAFWAAVEAAVDVEDIGLPSGPSKPDGDGVGAVEAAAPPPGIILPIIRDSQEP